MVTDLILTQKNERTTLKNHGQHEAHESRMGKDGKPDRVQGTKSVALPLRGCARPYLEAKRLSHHVHLLENPTVAADGPHARRVP